MENMILSKYKTCSNDSDELKKRVFEWMDLNNHSPSSFGALSNVAPTTMVKWLRGKSVIGYKTYSTLYKFLEANDGL